MIKYIGKYKSVYNPEIEAESDYIAREVARDLMYHNQGPLTEYDLDDLPPADVRPVVRGRWISDGDGYHWVYVCSVCGWKDGYPFNERHNFCPKCGAEMQI